MIYLIYIYITHRNYLHTYIIQKIYNVNSEKPRTVIGDKNINDYKITEQRINARKYW